MSSSDMPSRARRKKVVCMSNSDKNPIVLLLAVFVSIIQGFCVGVLQRYCSLYTFGGGETDFLGGQMRHVFDFPFLKLLLRANVNKSTITEPQ